MGKIKVGIIMGGPSSEYEVSLASGENVYKNFDLNKFELVKINILRDGKVWVKGRFTKFENAIKNVDICFLATHGEFGEDGRLQAILDSYGVKYTGSGVLASALSMNKSKSRQIFQANNLNVPKTLLIKDGENFQSQLNFFISKVIKFPLIVKPCSRGSSLGVFRISNKKFLKRAIREAFKYDPEVLIEEYIDGREFSCGVFEIFKNGVKEIIPLPVIEIIPNSHFNFFSYQANYKPKTIQELVPAQIDSNLTKEIQEMAIKAHKILGCKDYSRSDFRVKNGKIYILELNTLPALTSVSLFPKALEAGRFRLKDFLSLICLNNLERIELNKLK